MQEGVLWTKWTNLSRNEIARRMTDQGHPVGPSVVARLPEDYGLGHRKARENRCMVVKSSFATSSLTTWLD